MSSARVCVEWGFGDIVRLWAFIDFRKNTKILLQPVAEYYAVATLLTNCYTCLYGNNVATHFNLQPPTLTCGTCPFTLEWLPKVDDFVANKFAFSLLCVSEMASNDI